MHVVTGPSQNVHNLLVFSVSCKENIKFTLFSMPYVIACFLGNDVKGAENKENSPITGFCPPTYPQITGMSFILSLLR